LGFNKVIEAAKQADAKQLKVVVGLQRHYQNVYLEAFKKVHEEKLIGDVRGGQAWWNGRRPWIVAREPGWTEMEYQMRNWYHFNWLCGDHISEQHVHNIDVMNWFVSGDSAKGGHPVIAQGMGGRAGTEPRTVGEIFDHHYVEFRYGNELGGAVMNSQCRHIEGTWSKVAEEIHGSEGVLHLGQGRITDFKGNVKWQYRAPREGDPNPYQVEHDHLHKCIRENVAQNDAYFGANSSFTSVLGRLATYSGQEVKWDDAVKSNFSIMPKEFDMNAEAPVKPGPDGNYAVAVPGQWKLPWA
jgi:predicted dehydrogenase